MNPVNRIKVDGFGVDQGTCSFDYAPQREEFSSDEVFESAVRLYKEEWLELYNCGGCGHPGCPRTATES